MDNQLSMTPLSVSPPTFKKIVGGVFVCLLVCVPKALIPLLCCSALCNIICK